MVALCVPQSFGDLGVTFALAYGVVRVAQIGLFMLASRDDPNLRRSIVGLAVSTAIGVGLLLVASSLDGFAQGALWALALALDMGGPYLFGSEGWKLMPTHFAERHGLIIIIALGESIVAIGLGVGGELSFGQGTAAVVGMGLAAALWWLYFDVVALVAGAPARAGAGRPDSERAGARLLLLPPLPDDRRDRAHRARDEEDAGRRLRSVGDRDRFRAARRPRHLPARPRRQPLAP